MENGKNFVFATRDEIASRLNEIELKLYKIYTKSELNCPDTELKQFRKKQVCARKFLNELEAVRYCFDQAQNIHFLDTELFTEILKKARFKILFEGNFCALVSTSLNGKAKSYLTLIPLEEI